MKKLLLSTMLLAGMSLGFAKGTPVNQTNGTETIIASEKPSKVETYHFDSKEELDKFLKKDKCIQIIAVVETNADMSINILYYEEFEVSCNGGEETNLIVFYV